MAVAPSLANAFFLVAFLVVLLPAETYAFGAGDIPDFAYLNDKAFRHGDIENILETLAKTSGAAIGGSGLLGFASSVIKHASGGSKFTKSDVKKVYFGNWLRDYSQAMDIAGLSKLSADTLVLIVAVLGFMTFGFSTNEFQVTADRLGVYLPVEHIDNPKGYAEKEGDARNFHPKLRPPVSPHELEIDSQTGMKKYIATENQGWDTSTAFIRRTFRSCIEYGRRAGGREGADLWEAYRLLGTGLHTMEDLLAHSNWCELALRKIGYQEVFCHVGDNVTVNTPNGQAPPLVTGTFGSADFMHSLLGEAGDKLSQASVTDLSAKMDNSSQKKTPDLSVLKNILSKLGGGEDKLNKGEEIKQQSQGYNFDPNNIAPPEVQKQLLELLKWHDDIFRSVNQKIEMVPGLTNLMEEFSNALNEYIYTVLAPYLGPILTQATGILNEGSKSVIDNDDQYEVFNNPNASDPSHSLLSKDHFGLILNEPAGKIAQIVVENSVNLIVKAWSSNDDADEVITRILEAFHHPYYATGRSEIQNKMIDHMERWIGSLGHDAAGIIESLTKESVRNHKNKRAGLDESVEEAGYAGCGHGHKPSKTAVVSAGGAYAYQQSSNTVTGSYNSGSSLHNKSSTHTSSQSQFTKPETYGAGRTNTSGGYGTHRRDDDDNYGKQGHQESSDYDHQEYNSGGRQGLQETSTYKGPGRQGTSSYSSQDTPSYGRQDTSSYERQETSSYGRQETQGYGRPGRQETQSYGGHGLPEREDSPSRAYQRNDTSGYGHQSRREDDDQIYGRQQHPGFGGQGGGYTPAYSRPQETTYGRDNDNRGNYQTSQPSYVGGQGGYRQGNESSHGRQKKVDSDDERKYNSSYGGNDYGRNKKDESDSDDDKGRKKKHGGRRDDSDNDDKPHRQQGGGGYGGGYGGGQPSQYGQPSHQQSGYGQTPGYAPSYGGRDDTFGAERLDIGGRGPHNRDGSDSEDDKRKHGRRGHGGNRY